MKQECLPEPNVVYEMLFSLAEYGTPKPGTSKIIDVGTSSFINYVESEILDKFISNGGSTCKFFEGSYGSGKTHLLQLIEDTALSKGFVVCRIDLSHCLSFERWDHITKYILENCCIKQDSRIISKLPDILAEVEDSSHSYKSDFKNLQMQHPCFQNAMLYALNRSKLDENSWIKLRRYLLGEKVTVREMKESGLKRIKKPLATNNAEQVLATVLNSFYHLGFKGTILLFDETDRSWVSTSNHVPKKVKVASNIIRRFIDSCSSGYICGTLAVFAVLPNFINDCALCYPALGERLAFERYVYDNNSWRWPVQPVNVVNSFFTNEDSFQQRVQFLEAISLKFKHLIDYCGGSLVDAEEELYSVGMNALQQFAGENYKRAIIKALAECSIEIIDS